MAIVEYVITFANKGEEIKRLEKKNTKHNLAYKLADIYHITYDETLSQKEKIEKIQTLASGAYWGR